MSILNNFYYKSLVENEKNLHFWEGYVQNLKALNFSLYTEKLKVPVLVPIGSRILFRGELKHTNEVTAALGADYFAKCSIKQAEVLRQHRIKDAESKLNTIKKEKEYLESQLCFTKQNVHDNEDQEIIEEYNYEEDKKWREKHRENMRQYKLGVKNNKIDDINTGNEELWNRLEELELQEELENELENMSHHNYETESTLSDSTLVTFDVDEESNSQEGHIDKAPEDNKERKKFSFAMNEIPKETSKMDLLQQVLNKQTELEERLIELKNKERKKSENEKDLIARWDEIEQLDYLEDEIDRLDDILENEDSDDENSTEDSISSTAQSVVKRKVFFDNQEENQTLEINFIHSENIPIMDTFNPDKGILKPSDIYEAFPQLFSKKSTSILKKKNYDSEKPEQESYSVLKTTKDIIPGDNKQYEEGTRSTIVIKDVSEVVHKESEIPSARPTSLFKMRRQQRKS